MLQSGAYQRSILSNAATTGELPALPPRPRSRTLAKTSSGVPSAAICFSIPSAAVVLQQGLRQSMVLPESFANGFAVVVGPATVQQAIDQLRLLDIECQHQIERHPAFCQHAVEGLGLRDSSRKAVEQAAAEHSPFRQADRRRCRPRPHRAQACRRSCSGPLRGRARCRHPRLRGASHRSRDGRYSGGPSAAGLESPFQRRADQGRRCAWGASRFRIADFGFRTKRFQSAFRNPKPEMAKAHSSKSPV